MAVTPKWRLLVCVLGLLCMQRVHSSKEVMHKMTASFSKVIDQCKSELNLSENIMQDLMNFWKEEYELLNRELGCVIMCMATKLDLVQVNEYKMHHANAHEFAKQHGADDEVAKQLVTMIHDCEKQFESNGDYCARTLEVAKCFRTKIHSLKWAPDMETVLEEIMAEDAKQ
ncbi:general odorant-binding protein 1 [Plodia interpunctella]|uniref:general odorant-binding protein 1 n=1 Tax=Plodia interpunctella TaxID=58824 RepID=UPI002367E5F3|nr:general odorant-binding protein 1-like [Plodia interpunctella]